jgi:hypothetical protein
MKFKFFLIQIVWILENLYSGSVSLVFKIFLSFYLLILGIVIVLGVTTFFICSALMHFFRFPVKPNKRQ